MLWPWWRMKGKAEGSIYAVVCFAGFNDDPENKKHLPIVILNSLDGYINEAVPISEIGKHFDQVDTDDVEVEHPEFIAEWRKHYVEENK